MIRRVVAILLSVAAVTWSGPAALAASADDSYVSPARVTVNPAVIEPGGRSTIEFSPGFFTPDEGVATDVDGTDASGARVTSPAGQTSLVSRADGALSAVFEAPAHGAGRYAITFTASRTQVVIVTVVPARHDPGKVAAHTPHGPDVRVTEPDFGIGLPSPMDDKPWSHTPDREGRVQIPAAPPEAPDWPRLESVPWSILVLAAIALIATTVTATLLIAARRRGGV